MEIFWFPRLVAHHPYIILMVVFAFSSICLIIPLTTERLPDFTDPQMVCTNMNVFLNLRTTCIIDI